jgi:hypothetical protein
LKIIEYDNKKPYTSAPVSIISSELTKKHEPVNLDRGKQKVESKTKKLDNSDVSFSEIHNDIELYSEEPNLEIIKRYNSIGLTRIEFQFFLAIFDICLGEYNKTKNFKEPIFMTIKDFHSKVLNMKNRVKKEFVGKYIDIFDRLSNKLITVDTYKIVNKRRKNLFIHGPIASITIISIPEDNFYGLQISPTGYLQFECLNRKHISNHLPREFIQLGLRENDNILFFGYHLVRNHQINRKNKNDKLIHIWNQG